MKDTLTTLTRIFVVTLTATMMLISCSAKKRIEPIGNIYLEDVDTTQKLENLPFLHSWVRHEDNPRTEKYNSIYIDTIRTDLIPRDEWKASANSVIESKADFDREAQELASYFREKLTEKINNHKKPVHKVVSHRSDSSIIIDIAITELLFSHPVARAGSLVSPIPGTGAMVSAMSDPHVAFAAKVYDGLNGQLLATVADRKFAPARLLDVNKLTVTSSPREIVSNWSKEIADAVQYGVFAEVERRGVFKLKPW